MKLRVKWCVFFLLMFTSIVFARYTPKYTITDLFQMMFDFVVTLALAIWDMINPFSDIQLKLLFVLLGVITAILGYLAGKAKKIF